MKQFCLTLLASFIAVVSFAQVAPITGPSSVCVGSQITLSDASPGGVWSSATPAIATITGGGVVTGVSAGVVVISYNAGSLGVATTTITVNPLPGPISGPTTGNVVCVGSTISLSAAITGGTWTSANTGVATIGSLSGIVTGVTPGTSLITYTLPTGCFASAMVTVNPLPIAFNVTGGGSYCAGGAGVVVGLSGSSVGVTYQLYLGLTPVGAPVAGTGAPISFGLQTAAGTYTVVATITLTGCTATMSGSVNVVVNPLPGPISGPTTGNQVCVGQTITLTAAIPGGLWSSSNTTIATIGSVTGIVTGVAPGTCTITYTLPTGCSASTVITVNPLPSAITGTLAVCVGNTTTLNCTPAGGTWSSSSPSIATIGSSSGVVTGVNAGTSNITYTLSTGCYMVAQVTVNPLPSGISGTLTICVGTSTTLTSSPSGGVWTSSNPGCATIGSATGIVTGVAPGTTTITYTLPTGCSKSTVLNVIITPGPITGPSTGNKVCVSGTITLSSSPAGGGWSSSVPSVATVGPTTGIVTGISPGTTVITYSFNAGCSVSTIVTVNPLPAAITGTGTVCVTFTTTLSCATPGGNWSSGSPSIATVGSSSGIITGVAAGTANITYTLPTGCSSVTTVTVSPLPCGNVGVENVPATNEKVQVFPNPANDVLTISADAAIYHSLIIANNVGQVLIQQQITTRETNVGVRTLPPGIYYITVRGDAGTNVLRFLKM